MRHTTSEKTLLSIMRLSSRSLLTMVALVGMMMVSGSFSLVILAPPRFANISILTPHMQYVPNPIAATAEVLLWDDVPVDQRETAFVGKIVFSGPQVSDGPAVAYTSFEGTWRGFLSYGTVGVIYADPGLSECNYDQWDHSEFEGRMITEMGLDDANDFQAMLRDAASTNESIVIHLAPGDYSPWRAARNHPIFIAWQIFYAGFGALCASFAFSKLFAYWRIQGIQLSVAQLCLTIQWIANTIRTVYFALDPGFLNRGIFNQFGQNIVGFMTWPAEVICTLLVALYWHEAITKTDVKVRSFLHRLRVPFIIISVLCISIEGITLTLRVLHIATFLAVAITSISYFLMITTVTVYFFVIAGKTLRQLSAHSAGKNAKRKRALRKTTIFVIVSGVFNLIWVIATINTLFNFYSITGFYTTWSLAYIAVFGASFTQTLTFKRPKKQGFVTTREASGRSGLASSQSSGGERLISPRSAVHSGH